MLAQTTAPSSLSLLVILAGALIVAVAVSLAMVRILRGSLVAPKRQRGAPSPIPDAWDEAARRIETPPEDL